MPCSSLLIETRRASICSFSISFFKGSVLSLVQQLSLPFLGDIPVWRASLFWAMVRLRFHSSDILSLNW